MTSSLFLWTAASATAWAPWLMNWTAAQVNDVVPAVERGAPSRVTADVLVNSDALVNSHDDAGPGRAEAKARFSAVGPLNIHWGYPAGRSVAATRPGPQLVNVLFQTTPARTLRLAAPAAPAAPRTNVVWINQQDDAGKTERRQAVVIQADESATYKAVNQAIEAVNADAVEVVKTRLDAPGWRLGVSTEPIPDVLRSQLKLEDRGLSVLEVYPDTAAAEAGLEKFDVITAVGGAPVNSVDDLIKAIAGSEGKKLKIELIRDGEPMAVEVAPKPNVEENQLEHYHTFVNRLSNGLNVPYEATVGPNGEVMLRVYGLGAVVPATVVKLPDDVKVTISKQGDKPAEVVVKRGDEEFKGTESDLSKIPEDLQGAVAHMLSAARTPTSAGVKADTLMLRNRYLIAPSQSVTIPQTLRAPTPAEGLQTWLLQGLPVPSAPPAPVPPPRAVERVTAPLVPPVPPAPPLAVVESPAERMKELDQRIEAMQKALEQRLEAIEKALDRRLEVIEKRSNPAN